MNSIEYKGYEIEAVPVQLAESGEWTININIFLHRGSKTTKKNFSAGNTFRTKDEAIQHSFQFGKQIIDGQSDNCSVDDL